jgi:hypothetical protein
MQYKQPHELPAQRRNGFVRAALRVMDHDFGQNDAGKWYPYKNESKEIFLKFF